MPRGHDGSFAYCLEMTMLGFYSREYISKNQVEPVNHLLYQQVIPLQNMVQI